MEALLKIRYACILVCTFLIGLEVQAQSDFSNAFSGYYVGAEIGTISYNTQITFDGVNDPAGRGGLGYGVFLGYNHLFKKLMVGGELYFNAVQEPDPYTFDPTVIGFSELELKRDASLGFDLRGGYLFNRLLIFGSVGYSFNRQTVLVDGVPLDQFSGGSDPKRFGRILLGLGLEVAINSLLTIRCSFEQMGGYDLDRNDFGIIANNAALRRLDVEPSLQQFFIGVIVRL